MKNFILLLLFGLGGMSLWAQIEVTAPISNVKVYRGVAQMNHKAEVNLPKGMQTLVVHGLSPRMHRQSFQIKGVGTADIVHVEFRKNYLITPKDKENIARLKKSVDELEARITTLKAKEEALKTEQEFIRQNLKLEKFSGLTTLQQVSAYYNKRVETIFKDLFQLKKNIEPLQKKLKKLRKQLNELRSKGNRETYDAILTLAVGQGGKFHFGFSYLADGATWSPVYTIHGNASDKLLSWEQKAEIRQNTGLDWENIPVTLSSYKPRYHLSLPKVNPWYLRPYQPPVYRKSEALFVTNEQKVKETNADTQPETGYAPVEQQSNTLQVEYQPKTKYSVMSDNKPVLVHLGNFYTGVEYTYFSAPYQDKNVYLRARVKGLNTQHFLPGKARIYFEGVYTGEVYIQPNGKDEFTDLPMGIDSDIFVSRRPDKRYNEYKTLGTKTLATRGYVITVSNHKDVPIHIIVKDRFPVSQDERIKVKDQETDGKVNQQGIITWDKTVEAKQNIQLHFRFKIQYPKNLDLPLF